MLTRRNLLVTGAVAGASPWLPHFEPQVFGQDVQASAAAPKAASPSYFSPAFAGFLAQSAAPHSKKLRNQGLSVHSLRQVSKVVHAAADHIEQTSLDAVVKAVINVYPSVSAPHTIHAAVTRGVAAYKQYDSSAVAPEPSFIMSLTAEHSAQLAAYVARVGVTGVFRDAGNTFAKAAHEKKTLGLRQTAYDPQADRPSFSDGVFYSGQGAHLQSVCSIGGAKKVICSRGAEVGNAGVGLALAALTVACNPAVLPEINAAAPGLSIPLDAACAVLAVNPGLAIAGVVGLVSAVIGTVQAFVC